MHMLSLTRTRRHQTNKFATNLHHVLATDFYRPKPLDAKPMIQQASTDPKL